MTFEARYKPTDNTGAPQDIIFEALLKAWLGKKELPPSISISHVPSPGPKGLWAIGR